MKLLPLPRLSTDACDGYAALICPRCNSEHLHQGRVEIYDRSEDETKGLRVAVENRQATVDTAMTGNPSGRRQGVRIHFDCEICEGLSALTIVQHKGNTFFAWERADV